MRLRLIVPLLWIAATGLLLAQVPGSAPEPAAPPPPPREVENAPDAAPPPEPPPEPESEEPWRLAEHLTARLAPPAEGAAEALPFPSQLATTEQGVPESHARLAPMPCP